MDNITNEKEARYLVVTLLQSGKLDEAEDAITTFCQSGIMSCENEVFYRFLLAAATRRRANFEAKESQELHSVSRHAA